MKKFTIAVFLLYIVHFTLYITPTYAASPTPGVDIKEHFGFGNIGSLGEGTTRLVVPAFQVTAAAVVIYFLLGAFKYLRAGGNKEELEGARQMIVHAIIGFIILMFAFLVLQFMLARLFNIENFQII